MKKYIGIDCGKNGGEKKNQNINAANIQQIGDGSKAAYLFWINNKIWQKFLILIK